MKRDDQFAKNNLSVAKSSSCTQVSVACGSFQFLFFFLNWDTKYLEKPGINPLKNFLLFMSVEVLYIRVDFDIKKIIYREIIVHIWILASL